MVTAVASSKAHGGGGGGGYQEPPGAATDEAGYQGLLDAPSDGMYNEITTDGIGGLGVGAYANVTDGDDGGYMLTSATGSGNSETNQVCVCVCVCVRCVDGACRTCTPTPPLSERPVAPTTRAWFVTRN